MPAQSLCPRPLQQLFQSLVKPMEVEASAPGPEPWPMSLPAAIHWVLINANGRWEKMLRLLLANRRCAERRLDGPAIDCLEGRY